MSRAETAKVLTDITTDRLALLMRHEAGARVVSHYDFNNTYQYVIAREQTHLEWLRAALDDLDAAFPAAPPALPVPAVGKVSKRVEPSSFRAVLIDDAARLAAFVDRWREVVTHLAHARHRTMLGVVLGESREHQRLFEQAAAGIEDVIGRRTPDAVRVGAVLPTRWME